MNINTETSSILPETPFGNDANAAHIYKALETWNHIKSSLFRNIR
jgi:hypothetical protein